MSWQLALAITGIIVLVLAGVGLLVWSFSLVKPLPKPDETSNAAFHDAVRSGVRHHGVSGATNKPAQPRQKCPVWSCRIETPHSHVDDFMRRLRGQ